jgi:NitT/TauT family transport system substrate-binding protein
MMNEMEESKGQLGGTGGGELSRRRFLGGVGRAAILAPLATGGLGVVLSAGDRAASAAERYATRTRAATKSVNMTTGQGLINSFLDQYVAADLGFWSKRGLDVNIISGINTSDDIQEVVSGSSDFTIGGYPTIPEVVAHNLGLVNVVGDFQRTQFVIGSYSPNAITSVKQLRGKTIGIISVGGAEVVMLDLVLHLAGIPTSSLTTPVVGIGPGVYQLAVQGKIDGWMGVDSVDAALIAAGSKITDLRPPAIARNLGKTAQAYMTRRDLIKSDPKAVQAYVDGTIEALEFCTKKSHWRQAAASWQKYDSTASYAQLASAMPTLISDWTDGGTSKVGTIDLTAYQESLDLMHSAGTIKKKVSADTVATTEFVERAWKTLKI